MFKARASDIMWHVHEMVPLGSRLEASRRASGVVRARALGGDTKESNNTWILQMNCYCTLTAPKSDQSHGLRVRCERPGRG